MHLANAPILAAVVAVLACSKTSVSTSTAAASREDGSARADGGRELSSPRATTDQRPVRIAAFDCEKYPPLPGQPEPKGLVSPTLGIRGWHGGGPDGANWNVDDLRCTAQVTTACRDGRLLLTARIGRSVVMEKELPLAGDEWINADFVIPEKTWRRYLDEARRQAPRQPFRTAVFRLLAEINCRSPEIAPGQIRFGDLSSEDTFVAGFADGE